MVLKSWKIAIAASLHSQPISCFTMTSSVRSLFPIKASLCSEMPIWYTTYCCYSQWVTFLHGALVERKIRHEQYPVYQYLNIIIKNIWSPYRKKKCFFTDAGLCCGYGILAPCVMELQSNQMTGAVQIHGFKLS